MLPNRTKLLEELETCKGFNLAKNASNISEWYMTEEVDLNATCQSDFIKERYLEYNNETETYDCLDKISKKIIIVSSAGGGVLLILLIICFTFTYCLKRRENPEN